jgi:hypothetical protein
LGYVPHEAPHQVRQGSIAIRSLTCGRREGCEQTMMCRIVALAVSALVLTACVFTPQPNARRFLEQYDILDPHPSAFTICYAYGCRQSATVQLSAAQWERIRTVFEPRPTDAAKERACIAQAIGVMESIVGPLTGTDGDIGGSLQAAFRKNQMDCEDEAVNTCTYLIMMQDDGLITYHDIYKPTMRGFMVMGWPHVATVLKDKQTGERFVVDSWFEDNGRPAHVVPYKQWKSGWRPAPGQNR